MPYIPVDDRQKYKHLLDQVFMLGIKNVGELNYLITNILQIYEKEIGESYNTHNAIVGCLACISNEWYRRKTASYEETKRNSNGDVY